MRTRFVCGALALLSLCTAGALAEDLRWENTVLEFHPKASDTEVTGGFRFENTGKSPVTIASVNSECGCCTTALLDHATFQPGEKSAVEAKFIIGQRKGRQEKHIRVQVAGREEPVVLTMVTLIPEQVRFTPNFVYWMGGEAPSPKTMAMTVLPEAGAVKVTEASSSNSHVRVQVEPVAEGKEYRVIVEPTETTSEVTAVLNVIVTPTAGGEPKTFQAYAQVKPPKR